VIRLKELCNELGRLGNTLIPQNATILTYCNAGALATSGKGTALAAIYEAFNEGKGVKVYSCEKKNK
jgi:methylthioribose-1-phosphate isomerase